MGHRSTAMAARYVLRLVCLLAATGSAPFALFDLAKIVQLTADQLSGPAWPTDFLNLYSGAYLMVHAPNDLYNPHAQLAVQEAALGFAHPLVPFLLPAYSALAAAWLGLLPYGTAYLAWLVVGVACILVSAFLLAGRHVLVAAAGLLLFLPVVEGLGQAQTSALLLLSLAALAYGLTRHAEPRWLWLAIVGCVIKPQFAPPLLLALAGDRRYRMLWRAGLVVAALLTASLLLAGHGLISSYRDLSTTKLNEALFASADYLPGPTLLHAAQRFLGPNSLVDGLALSIDGLLLGAVVWAWRHGLASDAQRLLQLALLPLVAVLAAPYALIHELSCWPVSFSFLLRYTQGRPAERALVLLLAAAIWVAADLGVMEPNGTRGADFAALLGLAAIGYIMVSLRRDASVPTCSEAG